ncbi:uncharacterized protein [Venturia canescens]|uniref:uncharacterized protein isoform X2 n=1 Tax=Venturia canescens TaxID=32260 RepID=UPI001C9D34EC|nr:uncharacterized protein LOC122407085 isoform X2 [Venturia canescens]
MCPVEISSAIPRGFHRIRSIGISLALLTTLTFNAQGHVVSEFRKPTEAHRTQTIRKSLEAIMSRNLISGRDVLIGHSGDPWGFRNDSKDLRNSRGGVRSQSPLDGNCNVSSSGVRSTSHNRSRRSVVHLYNMVVCATGCNPISYKGYGCYCGFLGSGSAVDGIDQCCRMHDRCYDATECPSFLQYFVPYYWKCYRGYRPICAVEHGKWGGSGSCAQRLCECDRALSECLRRFPCPTSKAVCTTSPWRLIQNIFMIF